MSHTSVMNAPVSAVTLDDLDAARHVLLVAAATGKRFDDCFVAAQTALAPEDEIAAIHALDKAGAIEEMLDASYHGATRWRIRSVTSAGLEVARLIRDDLMWMRLKGDLIRLGDPFAMLVSGYRDNYSILGEQAAA